MFILFMSEWQSSSLIYAVHYATHNPSVHFPAHLFLSPLLTTIIHALLTASAKQTNWNMMLFYLNNSSLSTQYSYGLLAALDAFGSVL